MIPLPLTTKLLLGLGLALLLSLGANVWQLRSAWIAQGEAKGLAERQTLQASLEAATFANKVNARLAETAQADNTELLNDLAAIAERGRETRTVIKRVNAAHPLPATCAPGVERMDAVNATLGAKP